MHYLSDFKSVTKSIKIAFGYSWKIAKFETFVTIFLFTIFAVLPYGSAFLLGSLVNTLTQLVSNPLFIDSSIFILFGLYAVVNSLPNLISGVRLYYEKIWYFKYQEEMEIEILRKRADIDIAHYENPKFQDLIQRAFQRSYWPMLDLTDLLFEVYRGIIALIVGSIIATTFSPKIYLIIIICSIPKFIVQYKYGFNIWTIWMKDSPAQRRFIDLRKYFTYRNSVIETKLNQSVDYLLKWSKGIIKNFNNKQLTEENKKVYRVLLSEFLAFGGFVFASVYILQDVLSGVIMVGSMVFLLSTLSNVSNSIADILANIARMNEKHLIVKDMIEFFETKPYIEESKNSIKLKLASPPVIEFQNVSFKYPSSETWSLRNLNLTLKAGYKIGLVGNNGAGKTTFIKLLARIYDPTEGKILVNGYDLKELDMREWWSYLGIMLQDFINYDFITKDAIAIGRSNEEKDEDAIVKAGKLSQSDEFIQEWKNKYEEPIGVEFEGVEPSKGQRQKLAIARTLYRKPFILILDEPTASVDAESEAKIFESLDNLPNSMTAILISHDFSTIKECDEIFVFDHGELVESGNHAELLKNNNLYANLYHLQAKRFD